MRSATIASVAAGLLGTAVVAVTALPASATTRTHSAGTSAAAAQTATDEAAPSGKITVEVQTVNGTGCPGASTFTVDSSPDNTWFSVAYQKFAAKAGAGADPTQSRKNCQLVLLVKVPQGFTYAIAKVEYHGWANLASGASATVGTNYYFQGSTQTTRVSDDLAGPLKAAWSRTQSTPVESLVFAPCGVERDFNLNTELKVDPGTSDPQARSIISIGELDGKVKTLYHFAWKHCN